MNCTGPPLRVHKASYQHSCNDSGNDWFLCSMKNGPVENSTGPSKPYLFAMPFAYSKKTLTERHYRFCGRFYLSFILVCAANPSAETSKPPARLTCGMRRESLASDSAACGT